MIEERRKARKLLRPVGGSKRRQYVTPEIIIGKKVKNPNEMFNDDDPIIQRAYELGAPKRSKLASIYDKREPEVAIRTTIKHLRSTPYRKWGPELTQDAQKYLTPQIVNLIIAEQEQKKGN